MAGVLSYPLGDGGVLAVEAASPGWESGLELAAPKERPQKAEERLRSSGETLESALDKVSPGLKTVAARLRALSPDEATIEFGLTVTAESGVVVAKGSAEVHFTVTMTWNGANGNGDEQLGQPERDGIGEAGRREG